MKLKRISRPVLGIACVILASAGCAAAGYRASPAEPYRPKIAKVVPGLRSTAPTRVLPAAPEHRRPPPDTSHREPVTVTTTSRRLEPADTILVFLHVGGRESARIEDVLDDRGMVTLPLLGTMKLAGLSAAEAEQHIAKRYIDEGFYRFIDVSVVPTARSYFVEGHVLRPGRYELRPGLTVSQAIAATGGPTSFGNPRKIKLIRRGPDGGNREMKVNLDRVRDGKDTDVQLNPGDVLRIPRKMF